MYVDIYKIKSNNRTDKSDYNPHQYRIPLSFFQENKMFQQKKFYFIFHFEILDISSDGGVLQKKIIKEHFSFLRSSINKDDRRPVKIYNVIQESKFGCNLY